MPGIRDPGANTTAAADTGPASGLMPASSTPATRSTPAAHSALSYRNSLRRRCPSERFSRRRRATALKIALAPGPWIRLQGGLRLAHRARDLRPRSEAECERVPAVSRAAI